MVIVPLTLLIISGILSTAAAVVVFSFVPIPAIVSASLPDLDERMQFPTFPSDHVLSSAEVSSELKPLVMVVSPSRMLWSRQLVASAEFGAGALLQADKDGYLFATAKHVASARDGRGNVMVSTASGLWASAEVVGTAKDLDLALLWVPRQSGTTAFLQSVSTALDGEPVFVIGHPEGLKYTLSMGIVSSLRDAGIQISAAVSPGNSGGPVYDDHGNLIGIVSSKFDRNRDPNAENLSFAAPANALLDPSKWSFSGTGEQRLMQYIQAVNSRLKALPSKPQSTDHQD